MADTSNICLISSFHLPVRVSFNRPALNWVVALHLSAGRESHQAAKHPARFLALSHFRHHLRSSREANQSPSNNGRSIHALTASSRQRVLARFDISHRAMFAGLENALLSGAHVNWSCKISRIAYRSLRYYGGYLHCGRTASWSEALLSAEDLWFTASLKSGRPLNGFFAAASPSFPEKSTEGVRLASNAA